MAKCMIVRPHTMTGRACVGKIRGTGMGSVLLNGTAGTAATLTSAAPSPGDLGVSPSPSGSGLGKNLAAKLEKLRVQSKKKPENIKFSI